MAMDYTKLKKSVIKKNKKYLKFQRKNHVKRVAKLAEKRKATHPWTEELYKEIMRHE
jgi:hypothetical protein